MATEGEIGEGERGKTLKFHGGAVAVKLIPGRQVVPGAAATAGGEVSGVMVVVVVESACRCM